MTIILDLAPEEEAKLNTIAAQKGQNADTVAYGLFSAALAEVPAAANGVSHPATEWSAEFRTKYNIPADAHPLKDEDFLILTPEEEDEAICLALDDSFAGRVTPFAEWKAKFRARHNLPEGGDAMPHEDAILLP